MIKTLQILTCCFLVGCAYVPERAADKVLPTIIFTNGWDDKYSSAQNVFSRNACLDHIIYTQARLTPQVLHNIGELALSSNFFELPNNLPLEISPPINSNGSERLVVVSPCFSYHLSIYYKDKYNTVNWTCNNHNLPNSLVKLVDKIDEELYSLNSVKKVPESQCRYR